MVEEELEFTEEISVRTTVFTHLFIFCSPCNAAVWLRFQVSNLPSSQSLVFVSSLALGNPRASFKLCREQEVTSASSHYKPQRKTKEWRLKQIILCCSSAGIFAFREDVFCLTPELLLWESLVKHRSTSQLTGCKSLLVVFLAPKN